MKSPELEATDPNVAAVRNYIISKFDAMWNKLNSDADDLDDYIDVDSLAKVYLINELGKNWDSGATSFFLTYKPDKAGKYKFFASPVWDYDNSLGNAAGVERDLQRMGCNDYTLPSGWFSTIKGGYNMPNFLAVAAKNSIVMNRVYPVWFEDFLPAIDILTSSGVNTGELYSSDVYRGIIKGFRRDELSDLGARHQRLMDLRSQLSAPIQRDLYQKRLRSGHRRSADTGQPRDLLRSAHL